MNSQLFTELWRVFGGPDGVDEPLKCGHGGVDLENARGHGLSRVLLAIDEVPSRLTRPAPTFEILKAHLGYLPNPNTLFPEENSDDNFEKMRGKPGVPAQGSGTSMPIKN